MLVSSPVRDTDRGDTDTQKDVFSVLEWYGNNARLLPWRAEDRDPWGVLVSEVMLQQTQVSRVEPVWRAWMQRWPAPRDLAQAPVSDVIRAWQGMGYPRRALRLHTAAGLIVERHDGEVPASLEELRALPGIGEYTAAAVLAFAFGQSVAVLDTNVRRVLARWLTGTALPRSSITNPERATAASLLPGDGLDPTWSVAVMELGALVCTARSPACAQCPLQPGCAWYAAGRPPASEAAARPQRFEGSDRQARGYILRTVSAGPAVAQEDVMQGWERERGGATGAADQAERAMASLLADGLLQRRDGLIALP